MVKQINDRLWSWASSLDDGTLRQAETLSRLPIIESHVALMPDAHLGIGATVGSVISTRNAIIPSAVGVDIGCGMAATQTSLSASDLPEDLNPFLNILGAKVPAGVGNSHKHAGDPALEFMAKNPTPQQLETKQTQTALTQFGTLGSGNHFVEVCLDENEQVWLVLHSGSRGIGNQLAQHHITKAKQLAEHLEERLEDPNLAYFMENTPEFQAYIADMLWAQRYALGNRETMLGTITTEFYNFVGAGNTVEIINCHHNFAQQELFPFNNNPSDMRPVWITRKGAIKAAVGDRGIIPGSMGTNSYIVEGLGNPLSWNSCSHGAGRKMSRTKAKRTFSTEDLANEMRGKVWLETKAEKLVDEIPSSYKNIEQVMADQTDLVRKTHTLNQVLNYKGT
ncbi:MAG: RtcB family protein [Acidimicrobiia bacterium]